MRTYSRVIPFILLSVLCLVSQSLAVLSPDSVSIETTVPITADSAVLPVAASQADILQERLFYANEVINAQDSLMNGFGTIYTIITILIAIVAIALPLITSRSMKQMEAKVNKMMDNLEDEMDRRITTHQVELRNKQIDESIEYLQTNPPERCTIDTLKILKINHLI